MDIAVAGAAAFLRLEPDGKTIAAARIALAAVAPVPLHLPEAGALLAGVEAGPEAFGKAARVARETAVPIDDVRGTAVFRRHIVGVLTRRALEGALARARGEVVDG